MAGGLGSDSNVPVRNVRTELELKRMNEVLSKQMESMLKSFSSYDETLTENNQRQLSIDGNLSELVSLSRETNSGIKQMTESIIELKETFKKDKFEELENLREQLYRERAVKKEEKPEEKKSGSSLLPLLPLIGILGALLPKMIPGGGLLGTAGLLGAGGLLGAAGRFLGPIARAGTRAIPAIGAFSAFQTMFPQMSENYQQFREGDITREELSASQTEAAVDAITKPFFDIAEMVGAETDSVSNKISESIKSFFDVSGLTEEQMTDPEFMDLRNRKIELQQEIDQLEIERAGAVTSAELDPNAGSIVNDLNDRLETLNEKVSEINSELEQRTIELQGIDVNKLQENIEGQLKEIEVDDLYQSPEISREESDAADAAIRRLMERQNTIPGIEPITVPEIPEIPSIEPITVPEIPEIPSIEPIVTPEIPEIPSIEPITVPEIPEIPSIEPIVTPEIPEIPSIEPIVTPEIPEIPSIEPIVTPEIPEIPSIEPITVPEIPEIPSIEPITVPEIPEIPSIEPITVPEIPEIPSIEPTEKLISPPPGVSVSFPNAQDPNLISEFEHLGNGLYLSPDGKTYYYGGKFYDREQIDEMMKNRNSSSSNFQSKLDQMMGNIKNVSTEYTSGNLGLESPVPLFDISSEPQYEEPSFFEKLGNFFSPKPIGTEREDTLRRIISETDPYYPYANLMSPEGFGKEIPQSSSFMVPDLSNDLPINNFIQGLTEFGNRIEETNQPELLTFLQRRNEELANAERRASTLLHDEAEIMRDEASALRSTIRTVPKEDDFLYRSMFERSLKELVVDDPYGNESDVLPPSFFDNIPRSEPVDDIAALQEELNALQEQQFIELEKREQLREQLEEAKVGLEKMAEFQERAIQIAEQRESVEPLEKLAVDDLYGTEPDVLSPSFFDSISRARSIREPVLLHDETTDRMAEGGNVEWLDEEPWYLNTFRLKFENYADNMLSHMDNLVTTLIPENISSDRSERLQTLETPMNNISAPVIINNSGSGNSRPGGGTVINNSGTRPLGNIQTETRPSPSKISEKVFSNIFGDRFGL